MGIPGLFYDFPSARRKACGNGKISGVLLVLQILQQAYKKISCGPAHGFWLCVNADFGKSDSASMLLYGIRSVLMQTPRNQNLCQWWLIGIGIRFRVNVDSTELDAVSVIALLNRFLCQCPLLHGIRFCVCSDYTKLDHVPMLTPWNHILR